ncbi:DMT family transporter [Bermanella marisrubri]|uniref:Predicted permease, DMT superfamily protein n=1 Tax=Bermanella marisrubri TaxID=207949 RepID=Q1N6L8_9GAMM|nr:DMT family transporter [Bermanella marisrubri]EAT13574.1 Predicted permease, DMT superfamily protein [Oceanobacter sp. RED65] [Bermanella marisrubri]QIZ84365.1 DMT family transporter [Bermanella marisrubri]
MPNQVLQGALLILVGEALLAIMGAIIKHLSQELPTELIVFYRNLFGLFMLAPLLYHNGLSSLKTHRIHLHLLRAAVGLTAMYGFFYVIAHMPLAEAFLVKLTTPFFLPIIAGIWLAESISRRNIVAIIIGFIGVVFILKPGTENFTPVALIGLGAAFLAGAAKVCIRKMGNTESSVSIVFYFAAISSLLSVIPLFWAWQWPQAHHWPWIVLMGIVATMGQLALTRAYRIANPGQIGPYVYSSVIYGASLGWIVWGETLLISTLIGSAFIVIAGLWNIKRQ